MKYFCDNPYCKNHVKLSNVKTIKAFRHSQQGKVHLCENCYKEDIPKDQIPLIKIIKILCNKEKLT